MSATPNVLAALWLATWTGSLAILVVLLLRAPVRRRFGAGIAYALWWLPIATWAALWLPARSIEVPAQASLPAAVSGTMVVTTATSAPSLDIGLLWMALWWLGAVTMLAVLLWQQRRFERTLGHMQALQGERGAWRAEGAEGLPAVVGLLRPRIILPADIDTRFDDEQRGLMLAHERIHLRRGDAWANALASLLRCVFWFNPLVHVAASRMRHDQELACDARVIATFPQSRRAYGEAMLKNATSALMAPLGCHWGITHPMKERVMSLKNAIPSRGTRLAGALLVGIGAITVAAAAWAAMPPRQVQRNSEIDVRTEGRDYQAQLAISVDGGASNDITLVGGYGKPFKVRVEDSEAGAYDLEGTVTRVADKDGAPAYRIATTLQRAGKPIGSPVLVVGAGRQARIKLGAEKAGNGFSGIEMDVRIGDVDATTIAALDDANAARVAGAHARGVARQAEGDAAKAAAEARLAAANAKKAADEAARLSAVDAAAAAQAARIAADEAAKAAEAAQEAAKQGQAVRIERRVIRTHGISVPPAPPAPPPPSVRGAPAAPPVPPAPQVGSMPPAPAMPPAPPVPATPPDKAEVHIERRVRNAASAAAGSTRLIADHAQAVAAGGRALTSAQAAALGLETRYRWVDMQALFKGDLPGVMTLKADIVATEKNGDRPRYFGYDP